MDPVEPTATGHPLVAALGRLEADLDVAADLPVWSLDTAATAATIGQLTALASRVAALRLAVLAHGETVDVAAPSGAAPTATWLAHATRATRRDAFADTRLAASLADPEHAAARRALAAGELRPSRRG